jgi:hypothetical protein
MLIVVAWAAAGFCMARLLTDVARTNWPAKYLTPWRLGTGAGYMVLLAMNLCVLNLRLLRPRPQLRTLARQPGFVAGVAVAGSVLYQTVLDAAGWLAAPPGSNAATRLNNYLVGISFTSHIAHLVILAWIILFLQRVRNRQIDWIEYTGRLLGWVSILSWFVSMFLMIVLQ